MAPLIIGIKEFRKNMATITRDACKKNRTIIVLNRNKPMFTVEPIDEDEDGAIYGEKFMKALARAQADVAAGRTYTTEEVRKKLGIK